jgi:4,5-dihydroxyphthalate decarboxylase
VRPLGNGLSLSEALATGVIDALHSPRAPSCFERGAPGLERLWPDARAVEEAYFERTRIFPIMHTLVVRRDLYERHGGSPGRWRRPSRSPATACSTACATRRRCRT